MILELLQFTCMLSCCMILLFRARRSPGTGEGAFQGRAGDVGWKDQSKADLCGCLHFLEGSVTISILLAIASGAAFFKLVLRQTFERQFHLVPASV